MQRKIPVVRKSVVPKSLTPKLGERNRKSIVNLLNPENGSVIAVPSQTYGPNVVGLHEGVVSISDADSTVFDKHVDKFPAVEHPSISEFQSIYGLIPDRISCGNITFNKKNIETLITPESWVIDNVITAFVMLLNQGNAFAVDTTFIPMLRTSIRLESISAYENFLDYYFQRNIDTALCKLKECRSALISIFNSKLKKTKSGKQKYAGDNWGLAVLHKSSASLRLSDSIHRAKEFEHVMPHILLLANSIRSRNNFSEGECQMHWTYCQQVYSKQ